MKQKITYPDENKDWADTPQPRANSSAAAAHPAVTIANRYPDTHGLTPLPLESVSTLPSRLDDISRVAPGNAGLGQIVHCNTKTGGTTGSTSMPFSLRY